MSAEGDSTAIRDSLTPSEEEIRAALARALSNPRFPASERRRAFLRFIVDETLAGRADRLKGYTVAVTVFGRDETFDSQTDPVVRLEARRLRRDLDSYYVDAGSDDPVRISIPKGSYVPHFERHGAPLAGPSPDRPIEAHRGEPMPAPDSGGSVAEPGRLSAAKLLAIAAIAGVLIVAGIAGWMLKGDTSPAGATQIAGGPSVVVLPFEALGATDDSRFLASGLRQELIDQLMRFPGFRLYTLPANFGENTPLSSLGPGHEPAYALTGSVQNDTTGVRVAARLEDPASGRVLWSRSYDRPLSPKALIGVQTKLAGDIATELGQPYGIVNENLGRRAATADVSNMQSYLCVLRAYDYRRDFTREKHASVLRCLENAVERDPDYSDAWAMLGWLYMDSARFDFVDGDVDAEYEKALQAASRAVQLAPDNTLALKALASIDHYMGRYDESERLARRAAEINPYDPDTLAQLGWRLAVRGKFDEGIPILRQAIERTANPPGWYFHLIAIDHCLRGDFEEMLEAATRSSVDGSGFSQTLIAIANTKLGNREAARQALESLPKQHLVARDLVAFLRRHGSTDAIVDTLTTQLDEARRYTSAI